MTIRFCFHVNKYKNLCTIHSCVHICLRFARKDEDKERSTSYKHVTKKLEDEPWVHVVHHQTVDPASERERLLLMAQHGNDVSEFHVAPKQYLEKLVTKVEEEETQKPPVA